MPEKQKRPTPRVPVGLEARRFCVDRADEPLEGSRAMKR
jgi:hypothetical protein